VANSLSIIILYAIAQCPLTLGLHCAELQINLSRDEAFWRTATSERGCRQEEYNSIFEAFTSWPSLFLSAFKIVLHWIFGLCVIVLNRNIYFSPVQTVYLGGCATLCACYVTYISGRSPKGRQPAAYGHLQTLVDLVDEWPSTMYWGHKSDGDLVCHAGTSAHRLDDVKDAPYCG
jgi:hypothetical protein